MTIPFDRAHLIKCFCLLIFLFYQPMTHAFNQTSLSEASLKDRRNSMLRDYLIQHPKPAGEHASGIVLCAHGASVGARGAAFCCTNPGSYWCRVGASLLNTMDQQNGLIKVGPASNNNNNSQQKQNGAN